MNIVPGNNDLSVTLLPMVTVGPPATKGDKGDPGAAGMSGANGLDGTSVTFVDYFTGNQHGCPNGGAIYAAGNPSVQTYVCNGSGGADGTAATRADGPCFDNVNRYVDCGNGTVTDTVTELIWLKEANCLPAANWAAASQAAAGLKDGDCGLADESSPGDWRLPTKDKWSATIGRAIKMGCSSLSVPLLLTDDAGTGCFVNGTSSFAGVGTGHYWSSTTIETFPHLARSQSLSSWEGDVSFDKGIYSLGVWPVRSGSR